MFDLRRATVVLFGTPLLKPQKTRYAKNLGGHDPLATSMFLASDVVTQTCEMKVSKTRRPLSS